MTLDIGALSLSSILGIEITQKIKILKKRREYSTKKNVELYELRTHMLPGLNDDKHGTGQMAFGLNHLPVLASLCFN